jgi:hypothetical protein
MPQRMFGRVTLRQVCRIEAPSVRAASSSSLPISSSTGTTSRIVNGMQMKIVTSTIDGTAKITWTPRASKKGSSHPPNPNRMTAASPTVTGDSANGRSTSAFSRDLPTNRCRTSTQAVITPKIVVTTTVITVMTPVRKKACCTSGRENVSTTFDQPGSSAV